MHSTSTFTLPPISDLISLPSRGVNIDRDLNSTMQNHHHHHQSTVIPNNTSTIDYNNTLINNSINNISNNTNYHFHRRDKSCNSSKMAGYYPPLKAKRKRASPSQLSVLNRVFNQTYFPSTELRVELGKHLGMSPRTVQIWFQNKRQSLRSRTRRFSFSSAEAGDEDAEEENAASAYYAQQRYQYELAGCPSSPPWTPTSGSGPSGNDNEYPFILPPPSAPLSSGSSPTGSASPVSMSSSPVMMSQDHYDHHQKINLPPLRLYKGPFYSSSPVSSIYPSPISIDSILH